MIEQDRLIELMLETVRQAEMSRPEDKEARPKVGALLADAGGNILAKSHRGEAGRGDHAEFILLNKAREAGVDLRTAILFTTLEPCISRGEGKSPCLNRILESGVQIVYIGMLDPNPGIRGLGEIALRQKLQVERYPSRIIGQVEKLNADFMELHKESVLPNSSVYVTKRISDYVADYLRHVGIKVEELPDQWGISADDLERHCEASWGKEEKPNFEDVLRDARGEAYDKKYADYSYDKDARGLNVFWQQEIRMLFQSLREVNYRQGRMINVGIGNGLEANELFDEVEDLTIVDIAPASLAKAQERLPRATAICAAAENLRGIQSNSYDIYVSLRTYQSTYFGISRAVREACRVVKPDGLLLISVSNGFIGKGDAFIPGLVIPGTNVVDRNQPFEVADQIRRTLIKLPFDEVGVRTGFAEIYVYGRRSR